MRRRLARLIILAGCELEDIAYEVVRFGRWLSPPVPIAFQNNEEIDLGR